MTESREIDRLAAEIDQLRVDFERFFNGALAAPPEELRERILRRLRRLRNTPLKNAADQFRLGSLEARYNSFNELFNRRLREQEEGRSARRAAAPPPPRHDAQRGVVVGEEPEMPAVEALYAGLQQRSGAGRFDLESFRSYLQQQVSTIRQKTGCRQVQFRIADEGGKIKLKAKPVRTGG